MAVDTRNKRMAMIGLAKPFVRLMKNPSGTGVDSTARAMLLFLYTAPAAPLAFQPWLAQRANVTVGWTIEPK